MLIVWVTGMWVTEAIPFFVAALSVPPLVIWLQILQDPVTKSTADAVTAGKLAYTHIFDGMLVMVIGGASIDVY